MGITHAKRCSACSLERRGGRFINQAISMKYGKTSEAERNIQVKRRLVIYYLLHQLLLEPVHMLIYALHAGMWWCWWCCCCCRWWWWWARAWQDVCFLDRAHEAKSSQSYTPVQNHKRAREAIGLTARVMETAKPCRLRALGSAAVAQSSGGFWLPAKTSLE